MWKVIWLGIYFAVLIWSAIEPKGYFIWFLEVVPALIGLAILVLTYKKFPLTPRHPRRCLGHPKRHGLGALGGDTSAVVAVKAA